MGKGIVNIMPSFLFAFMLSFIHILPAYSQGEANYWYFGEHAGLDFSNGSPVALTNGNLNTLEGCAAISSPEGELMFYTEGTQIWQKNHSVMPNGTGLLGHWSSTQSAIIVPRPNHPDLYYVFTVDAIENDLINGLCYSMVDMSLDGGFGAVVDSVKNIPLITPVCEKITAVHNNAKDGIWVICHRFNTNIFHAYLVDQQGVNHNPVPSMVGEVITGHLPYAKGYLKASPDGSRLAMAHNTMQTVEIFDFNNETGEVSNQIKDDTFIWDDQYGIEFSPDGSLLYVSDWKLYPYIYQYDLEAGSPQDIIDSRIRIASAEFSTGALQLGPDNRIYVAFQNDLGFNDFLGVISDPNVYGTGCNFDPEGIYLEGRHSNYGLPPFIQSLFHITANFTYDISCEKEPTQFYENITGDPDSVRWDFGDPGSGPQNTSNLLNPVHTYENYGDYEVALIAYQYGQSDEKSQLVTVNQKPDIWLGNDTSFCEGNSYVLAVDSGYSSYLWQNGDTVHAISTDTAGIFWVEVTNGDGCVSADTIVLSRFPVYNQVIDTSICENGSLLVGGTPVSSPGIYPDTMQSIYFCDSIIEYHVSVYDTFDIYQEINLCDGDSMFVGGSWQTGNGIYQDVYQSTHSCDSTVTVNLSFLDTLITYSEIFICEGDSAEIFGEWRKTTGLYSDTLLSQMGCDSIAVIELDFYPDHYTYGELMICEGDSTQIFGKWIKQAGVYSDTLLSQMGCDSIVEIMLGFYPAYILHKDTIICEGDSLHFGFQWISNPGQYTEQLQTIHNCDSLLILDLSLDSVPRPFLGHDTILTGSQELVLSVSYPGCSYQWQDGSGLSSYTVDEPGTYHITVTCRCGIGSDTIRVIKDEGPAEKCRMYVPNAFSPDGDQVNDHFKPVTSHCFYSGYILQIYSRWGQLLFETNDPGKGWDGQVNGKPAVGGVYVYRITYTEVNQTQSETVSGPVALIR